MVPFFLSYLFFSYKSVLDLHGINLIHNLKYSNNSPKLFILIKYDTNFMGFRVGSTWLYINGKVMILK